MTPARIVSLGAGIVGLALVGLALLPIGLGILGFLGVLADVGPAENRQMGLQLMAFGLVPLLGGAVLLVAGSVGFFLLRSK